MNDLQRTLDKVQSDISRIQLELDEIRRKAASSHDAIFGSEMNSKPIRASVDAMTAAVDALRSDLEAMRKCDSVSKSGMTWDMIRQVIIILLTGLAGAFLMWIIKGGMG